MKDTKDNKESEKSQFNAGLMRIQHVNELLIRASNHYLKGQLDDWFFVLKNIKMNIISKIPEDDIRKELETMETNITNPACSKKIMLLKEHSDNIKIGFLHSLKLKSIEKYSNKLMDLMEERSLLIPNQTDETTFI